MSRFSTLKKAALVAAMGLTLIGQASLVAAEEWKFALEEISGSVQDAYAQKFKQLVEQKSGGKISVTVYPYGALGESEDLTELVANGVLQFAHGSTGILGSTAPSMQVFSVPYLLSQDNQVNLKVLTESPTIYGPMADKLKTRNLRLLSMYPEGEMVWTTNKVVRKPADFDNVKMRVMASPMLVETYKSFGAVPTPLPYSEVYGALQLKMIDGQENPIFAIEEMKFYEVTDVLTWSGHQQFTVAVLSSESWYQGLPAEQQKIIDETVTELGPYIFDTQAQYNKERLAKIQQLKPGIELVHLNEAEQAAFRKASLPMRDKLVELAGPEAGATLQALEKEIAALEQQ
ncbi:tripartite ATP-independent transporter DctP family solute receptor [Pseudomonas sp. SJZ079]|uniref:TRAP transporter substrate-binding protein n=1 Tax=Pseudomonas sp. SJZ079 TaxID=2572887 RepID=UPI00119C0566|nr:TRAP transporter substrate-binding protein DctP [Pseudomonas sp. SJZ079]TWC39466.1 tripartite ATP-independent transporter DctP family solute receptor [Pseudomonas sp. SJZ079]